MPKKKDLISIDFTEHDTIALLEYLIALCKDDRVSGLIYAVSIKRGQKYSSICGATGRMADDAVHAAGLASMLNYKFSGDAVEKSILTNK